MFASLCAIIQGTCKSKVVPMIFYTRGYEYLWSYRGTPTGIPILTSTVSLTPKPFYPRRKVLTVPNEQAAG